MSDNTTNDDNTLGIKDDDTKPRFDLIPTEPLKIVADIFTEGFRKYTKGTQNAYANNWQKGMRWGRVYAAMQRHANSWWGGETYDQDSGKHNLAHVICCAMMLIVYNRSYPKGDDRPTTWRNRLRIGTDLDGVLIDMYPTLMQASNLTGDKYHYPINQTMLDTLNNMSDEELLSLPPIIEGPDMPFEPVVYITARDTRATALAERYLFKGHYPYAPVIEAQDKVQACLDAKLDVFVEDHYDNFVAINAAGIACYLMDAPYNRKYDVGDRRIYSLHELAAKLDI